MKVEGGDSTSGSAREQFKAICAAMMISFLCHAGIKFQNLSIQNMRSVH